MLSQMREKFGPVVIGTIIGALALVFVFFGVFNPRATSGLHEGSVAGTVNGDSISISEFNRELNRRIEFFKQMSGGKLTDAQIKQFHIRDSVFQELVNRKLVGQAAVKASMVPSDEEVRDRIRDMPVFQKEKKFDPLAYRQVLEANNYTPASFERMMRDDLSVQAWNDNFHRRVHVSDEEIRKQFLLTQEKRNIKYVLLSSEVGRKKVEVKPAEIDAFLKDPAKLNLAKGQFEAKKDKEYKGKTFDQVKPEIAHDVVASSKTDEIRKESDKLAAQLVPLLTAAKSGDAQAAVLLKPFGAEIKSSQPLSRETAFLPGVGDAHELMNDAFAKNSPIDPSVNPKAQAKVYSTAGGPVVAIVTENVKADLTKLPAEMAGLRDKLVSQKERELQEATMKQLTAKAKIVKNDAVIGEGADTSDAGRGAPDSDG